MAKKTPSHQIIRPTKAATAVAASIGGAAAVPRAIVAPVQKAPRKHWQMIDEISADIAQKIALMANSINDSVVMVRSMGCDHPNEFNILVAKTNDDLMQFAEDYKKVKEQHAGKSGPIDSPDDNALSIMVFENYMQFLAKFDGTMHHTLISFTEYALEAKDRAKALLEKYHASAPAVPNANNVQPTPTEQSITGDAPHGN